MTDKLPSASSGPTATGGPLARKLADAIRQELIARRKPGDRLPAERELARRFACSMRTVRSALAILARQGLVERVQGSGTYVAERAGRISRTTGLLFYGQPQLLLNWTFCREITKGILERSDQGNRELHLLLGRQPHPRSVTTSVIDQLELHRFDSIVAVEVFNDDLFEQLAEELVTVVVDYACHRPGVSSCALDHRQTIDLAVEHLWRLGHRRIGLIGPVSRATADPAHQARRESFRQAMRARGLEVNSDWIIHGMEAAELGREAMLWHERPAPHPTALVCVSRPWTIAWGLTTAGLRIPEDVSLVTLDEADSWMTTVQQASVWYVGKDKAETPPEAAVDPMDPAFASLRNLRLATVHLPFKEMGRWAMLEVRRRLDNPSAEPAFKEFQGEMLPGNSVAPA